MRLRLRRRWRRRRRRRIERATLARATRGVAVVNVNEAVAVVKKLRRSRKIGLSLGATELPCGGVVGTRRLLRCIKSSKPDARLLARVADLGSVTSPWAFPNASVTDLFGVVCGEIGSVKCGRSVPWSHRFLVFLLRFKRKRNRKEESVRSGCGGGGL
ncbi:uncharacterized protein DS421_18g616910 [Arachis hypogaea]|nr:uncharacterized protein DS421_18g616910 [Arachis hypogaea]